MWESVRKSKDPPCVSSRCHDLEQCGQMRLSFQGVDYSFDISEDDQIVSGSYCSQTRKQVDVLGIEGKRQPEVEALNRWVKVSLG